MGNIPRIAVHGVSRNPLRNAQDADTQAAEAFGGGNDTSDHAQVRTQRYHGGSPGNQQVRGPFSRRILWTRASG